jgi:hypothetical protein
MLLEKKGHFNVWEKMGQDFTGFCLVGKQIVYQLVNR